MTTLSTYNLPFSLSERSTRSMRKTCILNAKIVYALGLKCYRNDLVRLFDNRRDDLSDSENSVYSMNFGTGKQYGSLLALSYESGKLSIQDTRYRRLVAEKQIKTNAVYDICWVPEQPEIVTASAQVGVDKWTLLEGSTSITNIGSYSGHQKSVTTIDVNPWDTVSFASGSRDGKIIVWDSRCHPHRKATEINGAHYHSHSGNRSKKKGKKSPAVSVGSIVYVDSNKLASIGRIDGCVKVWDLRKTYYNKSRKEPISLNTFKYQGSSHLKGYTSLSFSPNLNTLYVSCQDDIIYAYNLACPVDKPVHTFIGGKIGSFFVKTCVSPCGSYLLCGAGSDTFIWLTDNASAARPNLPIARLSAHTDEVTSIAWSNDGVDTVVTSGDDMCCYMFNVKHTAPNAATDVNLLGSAVALHTLNIDKPVLNLKRDKFYCVRPSLGSFSDSSDNSSPAWSTQSDTQRSVTPSSSSVKTQASTIHSTGLRSSVRKPWPTSSGSRDNTNAIINGSGQHTTDNLMMAIPSCSGIRTESINDTDTDILASTLGCSKVKQLTLSPLCPIGKIDAKTPKNTGPKVLFRTPMNTAEMPPMKTWLTMLGEAALQASPIHEKMSDSMEKKKEALKKRLSDYLGNDQENLLSEGDKLAKSPNKNILTSADNFRKRAMNILGYTESCDAKDNDDMEGIKPLDGSKLSHFMGASSLCGFNSITPVKSVIMESQEIQLKSPLADLPNYVVDGTSPHSRPEKPILRKRKDDWLTTLSANKKLKISKQLSTTDETTPNKQS